MNVKKLLLSFVMLMVILPFLGSVPASANTEESPGLISDGRTGILIEVETGRVLYEKNPDQKMAPASMTKIMPMLLVMEALESGNLEWDEMITASPHAASLGGTQIFLQPGEVMSVRDLFKSVAIASANDAVTALGERIAGSEESFVRMMNDRAKELGMENTVFKNPTGLSADGHVTTAADLAILARHLVTRHPEVLEYTSMYEDFVRQDSAEPFWLVATNKLVRFVEGVDGLKTGYTTEAGSCLTATAKRGNMRIVAVLMGCSKADARNQEMTNLINHAFASYELVPQMEQGTVVTQGYNMLARNRSFDIVTAQSISTLKGVAEAPAENREVLISLDENLELPIQPGDQVGTLAFFYNSEQTHEIPLTVLEPVERNGFFGLFSHLVSRLLFGDHR